MTPFPADESQVDDNQLMSYLREPFPRLILDGSFISIRTLLVASACTLKCLLMVSTIIFGFVPTCWLAGCIDAAIWQACYCGARIDLTPAIDYPVVEHSVIEK